MFKSIHFESKGRATTNASQPEVLEKLKNIVGGDNILVEPEKVEPYGADAVKEKFPPEAVLFPETTAEVSAILKLANDEVFPVTARGGGVGYTGGAVPTEGGIVIGTDRMNKILEISEENLYAVCQPPALQPLNPAGREKYGLIFPPDPASYKDSLSAETSPKMPAECVARQIRTKHLFLV
ncbi:MAG: FAD-binding oxidoreductase [Pyrinomonadaceae bacterium]